jgi:eukaryotic-like serine/threonine-protein kinase
LAPDHKSLSGTVIDGRYQLLGRIGEGGMGVVYKARQTSVDRAVAIKMLSPHLAQDPSWVQRFFNEAKACSKLQHPNTIRMFDFGQTGEGQFFMAMEFLEGLTLRRVIAGAAPMDPVRVLRILIQCCASLSEAHNMGIIHRDIKSDNIFIIEMGGQPDYVKVLDFSVAKLLEADATRTQAGVIFGTPQYMSPEQARGEPLGPRSDLYALGILAFEMLTGRVPFTDDNPMNVLAMHLRSPAPPLPPQTPREVVGLVMRLLEKDQKLRHPSAAALMEHAQRVLGALTSGPYSPPQAQLPPSQRFAAEQRTMLAGPPGGPGVPPPAASAAEQKTMMADASAMSFRQTIPADGSQRVVGGPPPAAPPAGYSPPYGDQRTVLLPDSSGVVSLGGPNPPSAPYPVPSTSGATATFWIICLVTGLLVGVGAYWLVLELGR